MTSRKCVEIELYLSGLLLFFQGLINYFFHVNASLDADGTYLFPHVWRRVHTVPVSPSLNVYTPPSVLSFRVRDKYSRRAQRGTKLKWGNVQRVGGGGRGFYCFDIFKPAVWKVKEVFFF